MFDWTLEEGATGVFDVVNLILIPDDTEFEIMAKLVLEEMQTHMNLPEFKKELAASFAQSEFFAEDIEGAYGEMIDAIEEEMELDDLRKNFLKDFITLLFGAWAIQDRGFSDVVVPYEICRERGDIPVPGYIKDGDAGMDVYALEDYEINPGERIIIPTGIKMAIPKGYQIEVRNKSGIAAKTALRVANTPGTVDSGYRDEIGVIIENIEPAIRDIEYEFDEDSGQAILKSVEHGRSYSIDKGTRFAQLVLMPVETAILQKVEDVTQIGFNRGGGFGSTNLD